MQERLIFLQTGRAVAALAVLLIHASHFSSAVATEMPATLYSVLQFGYLGVDFFFVLSGFIVSHSFASSFDSSRIMFLAKRMLRIYLPYLPVAIAFAVVSYRAGSGNLHS